MQSPTWELSQSLADDLEVPLGCVNGKLDGRLRLGFGLLNYPIIVSKKGKLIQLNSL